RDERRCSEKDRHVHPGLPIPNGARQPEQQETDDGSKADKPEPRPRVQTIAASYFQNSHFFFGPLTSWARVCRNARYFGSCSSKIACPAAMYARVNSSAARSRSPNSNAHCPSRRCKKGLPMAPGQCIALARLSKPATKSPLEKLASPTAA